MSGYPCDGCNREVEGEDTHAVWLLSPLGVSCVYAHDGCEEAAAASLTEQPARVVDRPLTKAERRAARRGAAA